MKENKGKLLLFSVGIYEALSDAYNPIFQKIAVNAFARERQQDEGVAVAMRDSAEAQTCSHLSDYFKGEYLRGARPEVG